MPGTIKPNQHEYMGMILNIPARVCILSSWNSSKIRKKTPVKYSFLTVFLHWSPEGQYIEKENMFHIKEILMAATLKANLDP